MLALPWDAEDEHRPDLRMYWNVRSGELRYDEGARKLVRRELKCRRGKGVQDSPSPKALLVDYLVESLILE